jgi:hypothetical protein
MRRMSARFGSWIVVVALMVWGLAPSVVTAAIGRLSRGARP